MSQCTQITGEKKALLYIGPWPEGAPEGKETEVEGISYSSFPAGEIYESRNKRCCARVVDLCASKMESCNERAVDLCASKTVRIIISVVIGLVILGLILRNIMEKSQGQQE